MRVFVKLKSFTDDVVTEETPKSVKERLMELPDQIKKKSKNMFRKKMIYKRVPILNWLPTYTMESAVGDLIAGITVGNEFVKIFQIKKF